MKDGMQSIFHHSSSLHSNQCFSPNCQGAIDNFFESIFASKKECSPSFITPAPCFQINVSLQIVKEQLTTSSSPFSQVKRNAVHLSSLQLLAFKSMFLSKLSRSN